MKLIDKLLLTRKQLKEITELNEELISNYYNRLNGEAEKYQQQKARGQCTAANKCKNKIVPQHTMCCYHLRKAAERSAKYKRKK